MKAAEIVFLVKKYILFLRSKTNKIILSILVGGMLGFFIYFFTPNKYISEVTFLVEEAKGGSSGLASLAGQFGIDFGGITTSGIFSGENVLHFFRSKELCREVLLSKYDDKYLLIDIYLKSERLEDLEILSNSNEGQSLFKKNTKLSDRENILKDSILLISTNKILKNNFSITRIDKKSSVLLVRGVFRSQKFSKIFIETIMEIATNKYISSKTKLKDENVKRLQMRADSLEKILNSQTYMAADFSQGLNDVNPALKTLLAKNEITSRSKSIAASLYLEVSKNLELSKIALLQVTPNIEIIDQSRFPLKDLKRNIVIFILFGSIFSLFIYLFFISLYHFLSHK